MAPRIRGAFAEWQQPRQLLRVARLVGPVRAHVLVVAEVVERRSSLGVMERQTVHHDQAHLWGSGAGSTAVWACRLMLSLVVAKQQKLLVHLVKLLCWLLCCWAPC
jgi:hypothetical protein